MTKLSINLNKIALLRNARGSDFPDLLQVAQDCERFGAQGITVHPRPDERHITSADVPLLKQQVTTELNIEGNPTDRFMQLVLENKPAQCTLVPDAPDALTSNSGWDTQRHADFLSECVSELQRNQIRVAIFVDPDSAMVEGAKAIGADRIELFTGTYAEHYKENREKAIQPFVACAQRAMSLGIAVNAGHDLNLKNLPYLKQTLPQLDEVSIGHALIVDALYLGLESTVHQYLACLLSCR